MILGSKKVSEEFLAKYGKDGELPPNFREISEKEFAQSKFFVYSPEFWEYRQITKAEDYKKFKWGDEQRSYVFSLRMAYFFDGTGIALEHDYWAGKVRYFSFAVCEHKERKQRNVGNCLNEYTCVACGFAETVDSSG
jgi:hypothetical protein